jgi:hypothetical protein
MGILRNVASRKGAGVADPAAVDDRSSGRVRVLQAVPSRAGDTGTPSRLSAELAAALRDLRGYVPQRIWWLSGAADALLAYQAIEEPVPDR